MVGNQTHVNCLEGSYNLLNWLKNCSALAVSADPSGGRLLF